MKLYSSGQVATQLGIQRDKIYHALHAGAPKPSMECNRRFLFTTKDVAALHSWFTARGDSVRQPECIAATLQSTT